MLGKPLTASRTARLAAAPAARRPARRARRAPLPLAAWLREMFGGQGGDGDKVVHFIRHGQTEMNVYLRDCPPGYGYGEPGFRDPQIHDTRLTPTGLAQAAAAAAQVARLQPEPEVVVVSPLTRALQTADTIFAGLSVPRLVHPLVAERLYLSSDVGRPRTQLEQEFPHYEFGELPHGPGLAAAWWHTSGSSGSSSSGGSSDGGEYSEGSCLSEEEALLAVEYEPDEVFLLRVERLRQWLAARPERSLAVVTHWGVLEALTGKEFRNCEVHTLRLRQLRARPHLLRREAAAATAGER